MKEKRGYYGLSAAMIAATMLAASMEKGDSIDDSEQFPIDSRKTDPWYMVNLSKYERKGKKPEQIMEMRKAKWEAMQ